MGDVSHAVGIGLRIVTGALIGLAALPVVFTLLRTRKPELGTPQLALSIRTWSIVAHVLAGVLIVGTSISEIWFSLDKAGPWLFAIYGAAAAIAVLGFFAFYLSFVAELPPPPPKPIKPKKVKKEKSDAAAARRTTTPKTVADADGEDSTRPQRLTTRPRPPRRRRPAGESPEVESAAVEAESTAEEAPAVEDADDTVADDSAGGLRNRRPTGKVSHRRRRSLRGVAVDE